MKTIGVVGLQGAVSEHIEVINSIGKKKNTVQAQWIKHPSQLNSIQGLIIPGGESTTIAKLLHQKNMFSQIIELGKKGLPIFGTCAGLILLSNSGGRQVHQTGQNLLGLMNTTVNRNAFGRQKESFEVDLYVKGIDAQFPCVFIRAPAILSVGDSVDVLATYGDKIVAARQNNFLATAFHPELTNDLSVHKYFLNMIE